MKKTAAFPLALMAALGAVSGAFAAGDPAKGEQAFTLCGTCHTGQAGAIAPDLHGVIGRKAGSQPDFQLYTQALKSADVVWTEETLSEFLKMPGAMIPGTTMAIPVPDETQRGDLIAYLKTLDE